MRCPNCEAGEMSSWRGKFICTNCGYALNGESYRLLDEPMPKLLTVLIADSLSLVQAAPTEENR